jgi:hypothetical protein
MPQHIRMIIPARQSRHTVVNVVQNSQVNINNNNNIMNTMSYSRRPCVGTMSTIFNSRGVSCG